MRINTHTKHLELGWALVKYSVSVLHCYYLTTNKCLCLKEHLWLTSVISFTFLACRHWLLHPLIQGMYSRGEERPGNGGPRGRGSRELQEPVEFPEARAVCSVAAKAPEVGSGKTYKQLSQPGSGESQQ